MPDQHTHTYVVGAVRVTVEKPDTPFLNMDLTTYLTQKPDGSAPERLAQFRAQIELLGGIAAFHAPDVDDEWLRLGRLGGSRTFDGSLTVKLALPVSGPSARAIMVELRGLHPAVAAGYADPMDVAA